jgi:hypothetical protein
MRSSLLRAVAVVALGGLLVFQVVRTTMVRVALRDDTTTAIWPTHPAMILQRSMTDIGTRSAKGEKLPPSLLIDVDRVARAMPLAPEPFLIKGALAQTAGRDAVAEPLYVAARDRDPRSPAARYFLAQRYLSSGRIADGLQEMAIFSDMAGGSGALAPALAAYARSAGAVAELRRLFRSTPKLEDPVLTELAGDPANADLILALRSSGAPRGSAAPVWEGRLIGSLIDHGEFDRAHRTWAMLAGVPAAQRGLFNPEFKHSAIPPPFNWTFGTAGGVAEAPGDGRLQLIFFGREDAVLAEQVLVLEPGTYKLTMEVEGDLQDSGLAWTIDCLPQPRAILNVPLNHNGPINLAGSFTVPQGCAAQRLRLTGTAGEFAQSIEFSVGKLALVKAGGA